MSLLRDAGKGGLVGLYPVRAVFKDPIHVIIPVNELEYKIVSHPIFLRLHGIKQLGFSFLVYPQAKHSRFEHSLGSMHVAYLMAESFKRNCPEALGELVANGSYEAFVQLVRLVGLLHDIGHLPYSHATEQAIEEAYRRGILEGSLKSFFAQIVQVESRKLHEGITCWILRRLLARIADTISLEAERAREIESLFDAVLHSLCGTGSGAWTGLFTQEAIRLSRTLVSGQITDADRMDYLVRDAHNTGATYGSIDISRLASSIFLKKREGSRALELVYPAKLISNIEELYFSRYMMYKWVYFHHKVSSIELTYRHLLEKIAKQWSALRDSISTLLPSPPESFWDVFHPESIWRYTVDLNVPVDDALVESLVKIASNSAKDPVLKSWTRFLFERRTPFISLTKRQEVLLTRLARVFRAWKEEAIHTESSGRDKKVRL